MIRRALTAVLLERGRPFSIMNSEVFDGFDLLHPARDELDRCMGTWNSFLEKMAQYHGEAAGVYPNPLQLLPGTPHSAQVRESAMRATAAWTNFCNQSLKVHFTYCCAYD